MGTCASPRSTTRRRCWNCSAATCRTRTHAAREGRWQVKRHPPLSGGGHARRCLTAHRRLRGAHGGPGSALARPARCSTGSIQKYGNNALYMGSDGRRGTEHNARRCGFHSSGSRNRHWRRSRPSTASTSATDAADLLQLRMNQFKRCWRRNPSRAGGEAPSSCGAGGWECRDPSNAARSLACSEPDSRNAIARWVGCRIWSNARTGDP